MFSLACQPVQANAAGCARERNLIDNWYIFGDVFLGALKKDWLNGLDTGAAVVE